VSLCTGLVDPWVEVETAGPNRNASRTSLCSIPDLSFALDSIDERGNLQCAYHGWSFAGQGACVNIPQAEADIKGVAEKSGRACARVVPLLVAQGMVWLWPDNSAEGMEASRQQPPNTVPELHDPAFVKGAWVTRDLEYGYDTLVENVVDPAHVPFAHHGVQAQRSMAMPLNVTLRHAGPDGVFLCLPRLANSTIGACTCSRAGQGVECGRSDRTHPFSYLIGCTASSPCLPPQSSMRRRGSNISLISRASSTACPSSSGPSASKSACGACPPP
jgi:nitrite reductase/ring-hydroxylating ferredoxin subunit